ncbi:helix-turn-helix transcriptional regulator [Paenibacillus antri]|uniref:Helix-turn-helix transcriptional regulator n=1 Tax=Paenibacillus antri TaxID=2582848 RepID=A0A5R9G8H0_9BACL|nr:AraC family transcriptional regulator [Paenibacillus antri]TLS51369.1 helix-turn-helix transcriptional regulator [Paenibacillus antri]
MFYKEYKPCAELEKYIKCFWIMERTYDDRVGRYEYLWPTGLTEILMISGSSFTQVIGSEEIRLSDRMLIGAHRKRFTLKNEGDAKLIGIRAYNHGAYLLFGLDPNAYAGSIVDYALPGLDAESLLRMDRPDVVDRLNDYCQAALKPSELLDVFYKIYREEQASVEELSARAHLSKRQLERKVKEYTSFTPSELKNIVRFDRARLKLLFTRDPLQAMHDAGYYDYSHFSREFKRYYDMTPKQFVDWLPFYGK